MGYSENVCQICAVSFNHARCRTKYEPPEAAWGHSTSLYYAREARACYDLSEESGCEKISRNGPLTEHIAGPNCVFDGGYSGYRISVAQMKVGVDFSDNLPILTIVGYEAISLHH